jgi:HK97 family phage major capsid protein
MSLTTTNAGSIVVPETLSVLVIAAAARASVAMRASTVVTTPTKDYRVPVVSALPQSRFVQEGQELAVNDATIEELLIVPAKVGHVAPLSRELVRDSFDENAPEIVATAQGIDTARKIDLSFFGGDSPVANDGIGVLADVQEVDAGVLVNLDVFAAAQSLSEDVGGTITSFVGVARQRAEARAAQAQR